MTKFELMDNYSDKIKIKVIGVGGDGCNLLGQMLSLDMQDVEFICVNTDEQSLKNSSVQNKLHIGKAITKGLGAGADPNIGQDAAVAAIDKISDAISGADLLFIVAGLGGGTGSGAAPVIAELARDLGILSIAIVSMPYPFEGKKRNQIAKLASHRIESNVDTFIEIHSEKIFEHADKNISLLESFRNLNKIAITCVTSIADLILRPGLINVDFADIKVVTAGMGKAAVGFGRASGHDRAREATQAAIASPLLEGVDIANAHGAIVNVTAGMDLAIGEFENIGNLVRSFTTEDATIVVGTVIDPELTGELRVAVVFTGLDQEKCSIEEITIPSVLREKLTGDTGEDLDYLEIPSFLRRQAEDKREIRFSQSSNAKSIKVIAYENIADEEIAGLILHLSNVYKSIGGDELIVQSVKNLPPNSKQESQKQNSQQKQNPQQKRAAR